MGARFHLQTTLATVRTERSVSWLNAAAPSGLRPGPDFFQSFSVRRLRGVDLVDPGHDAAAHHLGPDLARGQRPQLVVPEGHWQTATSLGAWTLVGCTVSPAFDFAGFEMAPPDWRPTPR